MVKNEKKRLLFYWRVTHKQTGKVFTNVGEKPDPAHEHDMLRALGEYLLSVDPELVLYPIDMAALAIAPCRELPGHQGWDVYVLDEHGRATELDVEEWVVDIIWDKSPKL